MKSKPGFEKFFKQTKSGAAKKEQFRQEKKKWKKERSDKIEAKKRERYEIQKPAIVPTKGGRPVAGDRSTARHTVEKPKPFEQMPLNKFIAHAGVCSRRDAIELVKGGKVKVNGELILEPGYKVKETDEVKLAGKKISRVNHLVYILLNKPKDYITTTNDPQKRKTVLDLIKNVTGERVYPVGRLDRNTSGVLLLTNDGELAQKLTHPSNEVRKIYAVTLDKPLTKNHFDDILRGVELEDGPAKVDSLAFTDAKDHTQVGIELHSGKNRVVRRIFEHLGYDVKNLDRVMFAGLTKKNIQRGKWRILAEKEVRDLKFFKKGKA